MKTKETSLPAAPDPTHAGAALGTVVWCRSVTDRVRDLRGRGVDAVAAVNAAVDLEIAEAHQRRRETLE